jgi:NADP-dependent 3-hydroxy acid dehydrogenase YdfG
MSTTPVWIVTGAGTGFGNAIAFEALKRGDKVIATGRKLPNLAALKAAGADIMELDVNAPEGVITAKVQQAKDIYGRLDYVISAAGYGIEGACEEAS